MIEVNGTIYRLPNTLSGCAYRQESPEHVVIYRASRTFSATGTRTLVRQPLHIIMLNEKEQTRTKEAELIDYDRRKHPILSQNLREELMKLGIVPQSICLPLQQRLIAQMQRNGGAPLSTEFLKSIFPRLGLR